MDKQTKILILGGAGFVGVNLCRRFLKEDNLDITVVDFLDSRLGSKLTDLQEILPQLHFIKGDIRDEKFINNVIQGHNFIINCAAQTSHPLSIADPFFDTEINCIGNLRILDAVRRYNKTATVVYVSSSTVIGKAIGDVIEESHWERPLDIYSANKGVAEKYYRIYNKVYDIRTVILRFANLFGPFGKNSPDFGFINYFIHEAWNNRAIKLYKPGSQTRNVLYIEDAADLILQALYEPKLIGEMYFAVSDEHISVKEIANTIVNVFGRGKVEEIDWPELSTRIEIDNVIISSAKLRSQMKWKPRYTFREGLLKTREELMKKAET